MGKFQDASDRTRVGVFADEYIFVDNSQFLETLGIEGKGLFAATDYEVGDVIQEYRGKIISDEEAEQKTRSKNYMMDVKENHKVIHVIDAANSRSSSAVKFVNTTLTWNDHKRNAEFTQYNKKIYLVATKKIKTGSEILVYYGPDTKRIVTQK